MRGIRIRLIRILTTLDGTSSSGKSSDIVGLD
jgi:hypothetical protein